MPGTTTKQAHEAVLDAAAALDVDALADDVSAVLMRDVFGDRRADRRFCGLVAESTRGNLTNIRDVFGDRVRVEDTRATDGALELACVAAELRLPEAALERAYRAGQNRFWASWFRAARTHAAGSGQDLGVYLERPSDQLFGYIGHVLDDVGARYRAVAADRASGREHLRETVLRRIADGDPALHEDEIERVLGYPPGAAHAFVVLRPGGVGGTSVGPEPLRHAVGALATLTHREGVDDWGVWLALPDRLGPGAIARLRRALGATDAVASIAGAGTGLAGMRAARARALDVTRVQRALGDVPRVVSDRDVRLETLLLDDPERAEGFVREELGPLAGSDERAARLRHTLLTWLSAGSHVSTAATLGVHEHTVRNRIREIEGLIGVPVAGRRAELQVALRLHRVSAAVLGHPIQSLALPS